VAEPPLESMPRPVLVFSIVPELVTTTALEAPFQVIAAVDDVERSVPPAAMVPVWVPLSVLAAVSTAPFETVKVCAVADIGADSAANPTSIATRLTPLRHIIIVASPRRVC
jgi:hypothetical protein